MVEELQGRESGGSSDEREIREEVQDPDNHHGPGHSGYVLDVSTEICFESSGEAVVLVAPPAVSRGTEPSLAEQPSQPCDAGSGQPGGVGAAH